VPLEVSEDTVSLDQFLEETNGPFDPPLPDSYL